MIMRKLAGTENALSDRIPPNLDRVEKWCKPNKIKLNEDKMQALVLLPKMPTKIM